MKSILKNKSLKVAAISGLALSLSLSSCKKDFGDINRAWANQTYSATIPGLFNNIVAGLANQGNAGTIYTSWVYQNTQLAGMYAASGYRLDNQVAGIWGVYYTALANAREMEKLIAADPNAAKMTNVKAMLKAVMAYHTLKNTFLYGDMPYTEAGKGFTDGVAFYRPKYDAQADIIKACFADLKWAIDNFTNAADQYSLGGSETLFANDISKWTKFANSIRLRYALSIHQKDAATANAVIAEALAKPLLAATETLGLYPSAIPNYFNDRGGWYRGNSYIRMGSTMWNAMSSSNATDGSGIYDLRCKILFEPNRAGEWTPFPQVPTGSTPAETGEPYAESRLTNWVTPISTNNYKYASLNFYYVADRMFPHLLISGAEVSLLKAEIYNRGIGGVTANAVTAKAAYDEGVSESVKFWYKLANGSSIWAVNKPAASPTALELTTMLANPGVSYSAIQATALTQIYKQQWIALFHQPFEAWTLSRRTNYATPSVALPSSSPAYNFYKLIYPQSEMDSNNENWKAVTGGADAPTKKPWFML
jgi:hypothetical protein